MQTQAVKLDELKNCDTSQPVLRAYPAEYLAFKALQEAAFGEQYKYEPEKTDHEIIVAALCEKYA